MPSDVPSRLRELAGDALAVDVASGQVPFERLEWIGDSVLDVLVSRHVALSLPVSASASELYERHSGLVRDTAMLRIAERYDLPAVAAALHPTTAEDRDTRHRHGDSVEAWIGAAWSQGGWPAADEAVRLLVLPRADDLLAPARCPVTTGAATALLGWTPLDPSWAGLVVSPLPWRRRLVPVGAAVVELAIGARLLHDQPGWDEGLLTKQRIRLTSAAEMNKHATRLLTAAPGFPVSDRLLLATLGAMCLDSGPAVATSAAAGALLA